MSFKVEQHTEFQFESVDEGSSTEIACEFCPNVFENIVGKNAHLFEHFERELCTDCNEPLIRIGHSLFVLHTKITCIKSTENGTEHDTEHQGQQTSQPPIEVNHSKNEIFMDEQHSDGSPNMQAAPPSEENEIEEFTVDESSIKIESVFFDSAAEEENSMASVEQQIDDDEKTVTAKRTKSTRTKKKRTAEQLRLEKELVKCPIDGCGQMIKRVYKPKHIKEKHGVGFKCKTCDHRFLTSGPLETHTKQCAAREKFKCEFCSSSYISMKSLSIHKYENHKSEKKEKVITNRRVRRRENSKILVKCNINDCDVMVTKQNMPGHMKFYHGFGDSCPECGKICIKGTLKRHLRTHRDRDNAINFENFTCDHCQEVFIEKRKIVAHMRHHVPEEDRVECKICSKKFIDKDGLRNHMRYHAESRYVCTSCGKSFQLRIHLVNHERIHTGERPFKCKFDCGKTFRTSSLKGQHERIHTGAKPFKCTQENCDKAYTFDVDLKRHLFSAHSIWTKKHPCPHAACENVIFPERKLLRKHLKIVHGIEN